MRLVGADDHMYPNTMDVMQWLADSSLLEMIVDKLNPSVSKKLRDFMLICCAGGWMYILVKNVYRVF